MTKSMSNIATSIGIAGSAGLKEQPLSIVRPDRSRASLWGALFLRDDRVRALIPLRR
jgi:hypothetical protein